MHDKLKFWLSIGGHIELDEDPVQAAIREVKEEVGLDITILGQAHGPQSGEEVNRGYTYLIPPQYMGRQPFSKDHEHITLVYFAASDSDELSDSVLTHEQGGDMKWVTMEELDKMELVPNIKFYATEALKALAS